ncbi:MAG: restriction endonuclease subunit S [Candidatus Methanofishera endochildressiae]|uniref:Restriction endonuclease subunit S n=1 Tax=Candidatus Methanofishera endochildressiae TaxID=2738884 RepID=A0A7Z0SDY6_9GAMM|nr:restriction endonuclease subunit S [Candidatus Methanofishera endochildressiae]
MGIYKRRHVLKKEAYLPIRLGANIGRTAIYQSEKKALASNHVNILIVDKEDPEYVAFVINSLVGRLQTERLSAGSAQAELYPKDIENFVIPFISEEKQNQIKKKVTDSFTLRKQSKHLLDCAKKAVEMAIEKDEKTAINWLESQIS